MRPERFDVEPNSGSATKQWCHWHKTFVNFVGIIPSQTPPVNKLNLLVNYVAPSVYEYIADCKTYDEAVECLTNIYDKPKNEIFARHLVATRRQQSGESLDQFVQALKILSKDCNFKAMTAEEARDSYVRDAFINGINSSMIRQRLLENKSLDLKTAFEQARTLEMAQTQSQSYVTSENVTASISDPPAEENSTNSISENLNAAIPNREKCQYCGYNKHSRWKCPASNAHCHKCGTKGHFSKVCISSKRATSAALPTLAMICSGTVYNNLSKTIVDVQLEGITVKALIDTGSSNSYVDKSFVEAHGLNVHKSFGEVSMASTSHKCKSLGCIKVSLQLFQNTYSNVELQIIENLCTNVIIGQTLLKLHSKLEIPFGGERPPLVLCSLPSADVSSPSLFENLTEDCKPIAVKSRQHSKEDEEFITSEVSRLLNDNVIRSSNSPWRAQVLVTRNENHKKRMVVDYSQTINRFTLLDAYPLPRIDDIVAKISSYKVFSTLDLKSAYHQIMLKEEDKPFTAFEAGRRLYEFNRIPFGVKNAVACFQRIIDKIIFKE